LVLYFLLAVLGCVILYWIIRLAVRDGMKDVYQYIDKTAETNSAYFPSVEKSQNIVERTENSDDNNNETD
jgi:hypothetical protein